MFMFSFASAFITLLKLPTWSLISTAKTSVNREENPSFSKTVFAFSLSSTISLSIPKSLASERLIE